MALIVDTDLLVDLERAGGSVGPGELPAEELAISVITVSELLHGAIRGDERRAPGRRAFVEHLLSMLGAIEISVPVARAHAAIWADLSRRGEVIGAHDMWIAATALSRGYGVATRNRSEYARVPGLRVVVQPPAGGSSGS